MENKTKKNMGIPGKQILKQKNIKMGKKFGKKWGKWKK